MSLQGVEKICLEFHPRKRVEIEFSQSRLSSDGGLLAVRELDDRIGLTADFADALDDARGESVTHSVLSMTRQRIFGILAGYEDQNDHDGLRTDPVFQLICDRLPHDKRAELASQPTLSRFENSVSIPDLWRLRDALLEQFLNSFDQPPETITLDVDAFDDETHGQQQLTLFHGYYKQHQYLPIAITCAENDMVVLVGLRHGTAAASLGVDDDLRYLKVKLKARWPGVNIVMRGDCGFGVPTMYDVCEEERLTYTFGIGMNATLKKKSEELLAKAISQYEQTNQKQRLFMEVDYQAGTWNTSRRVIIKVEVHQQGTNRRAVVSNRSNHRDDPRAIYDHYIERGESENRNKELKCELCADRLSDHRFMANFFRLYLHVSALNLLIRLRQATRKGIAPADVGLKDEVLDKSASSREKKRWTNCRRRADPLGEGFACTWRTMFIKVACEIRVTSRRVWIKLSSHWPYLDEFHRISGRILSFNLPGG